MFKPKKTKEKVEEIKEIVETVEPIVEEVIEDEVEFTKDKDGAVIAEITEVDGKPVDENLEESKEDPSAETTDDKPTEEQKVNLTPGEVISIVEFNLQRAIQSLQLLK